MVAVIAGAGLGLFNSSLKTVGMAGVVGSSVMGQSRSGAWVNASNGNLVLQAIDAQLTGMGSSLLQLRTYNSEGALSDGDGDGWRLIGERSLTLVGSRNAADSTINLTREDGSIEAFTWTGSAYLSHDGQGAHDTVVFDQAKAEWRWTEGSTKAVEHYDATTGRLTSEEDTSGNAISYTYDGVGRLTVIQDSKSQQRIVLTYAAVLANTSLTRLQKVETFALVNDSQGRATNTVGAAVKRTTYDYDNKGRLTGVSTDLTPENSSDALNFTTNYTYQLDSYRITNISQSDGTQLDLTYIQGADAVYRIASIQDASGTQNFAYDLTNRATSVTNALGQTWTYTYDAAGKLQRIASPANGGVVNQTDFRYDADDNLTQVIGGGQSTTYKYDSNGNCTLEFDLAGDTLKRSFNADGLLAVLTKYKTADSNTLDTVLPSNPESTRYVYDSQFRLRFVVSPEGRVIESRYDASGHVVRTIKYTSVTFDTKALAVDAAPTEAAVVAWLATQPKDKVQLSDYSYDFRGSLSKRIDYANVASTGEGVIDNFATVTEYVYGEYGQLLQSIAVTGTARATRSVLTSVAYDGLGRVISTTGASGTETTVYSPNAIKLSSSTGLTTLQSFDSRGRLLSVTRSDTNGSRGSKYYYDLAGQLRMTEDAMGSRRYSFYDNAGRLASQVDATGAVVSFEYNLSGKISKEIHYKNTLDSSLWFSGGQVVKSAIDDVLNKDAILDRVVSYEYDTAGRLTSQTDLSHVTTLYRYDGESRVTEKQVGERITRYFYDKEGLMIGVVDPLGFLTENKFDAAGRLTQSIRYSQKSAQVDIAPTWDGVVNKTLPVGKQLNYRLPAAYDADGDTVTYTVVGTAPSWISFDAGTLVLSGTSNVVGVNNVTIRADDGHGKFIEALIQINVTNTAPLWLDAPDPALLVASVDNDYVLNLPLAQDAESGTGLSYQLAPNSALPPGLALDSASAQPRIIGKPTVPGQYSVSLRAIDPQGLFVDRTITISVVNTAPMWGSAANDPILLAKVNNNSAVSAQLPLAFDNEGHALSYTAVDALPAGLTLNAVSGLISGTVTASGRFVFRVRASDRLGLFVERQFAIESVAVNSPPVNSVALAPQWATVGAPFSYQVPGNAFTDPDAEVLRYEAKLSNGQALPTWLTFDATTRTFSGVAPDAGALAVRVSVFDGSNASASADFTITLNHAPVWSAAAPSSFSAVNKRTFSYQLPVATDVDADTLVYQVTGLPSGLSFDAASRTISGTLNAVGSFVISAQVTDGRGGSSALGFTLKVDSAPPVWGANSLPNGNINQAYSATLVGAADPEAKAVSYSVVGGALPAGLSFNAVSLLISGTATVAGAATFTVRATDADGAWADNTFVINIGNRPPVYNGGLSAQTPLVSSSFAYQVPAGAFSEPDGEPLRYDAMLSNGSALPAWLTFNAATRTFSGVVADAGPLTIRVRALDGSNAFAFADFVLTPNHAPVWGATAPSSFSLTNKQTFNYTLPLASDVDADTLSYQVTGLPSGLSFTAATRTISGTLNAVGSFAITAQVMDGRGGSSALGFTINVASAPPIWGANSLPNGNINQAYSATLVGAADPEGKAVSYSLVAGALPAGLSFNAGNLLISGTATVAGASTFTLRATDADGVSADSTFVITIGNRAPVYNGGVSLPAATVGSNWTYRIPASAFTDPDGETLRYSVFQVVTVKVWVDDGLLLAGTSAKSTSAMSVAAAPPPTGHWEYQDQDVALPTWLTFDASTNTLSGTPTATGSLRLDIVASDASGAFANNVATLNVAAANRAPVYGGGLQNQSSTLGAAASYVVPATSFTDPDGTSLTYSASGVPTGVTFNPATRTFAGTATVVGSFTVTVTASDGAAQTSGSFSWTVAAATVNSPPVYNGGLKSQAWTTADDISFSFPATAFTDPNGDNLSFTASGMPSWFSFDSATRSFWGLPIGAGKWTIIVTASDGRGGSASGNFAFTVTKSKFPAQVVTPGDTAASMMTGTVSADGSVSVAAVVSGTDSTDVLSSWRPAGDTGAMSSYYFYDGQGRQVGSVDERGFLKETVYDIANLQTQSIQYKTPVAATAGSDLSVLRQAAGPNVKAVTNFDAFGRVASQTDIDGSTVTQFAYDGSGRLIAVTSAATTADARVSRTRYNAFGEVTGSLSGEAESLAAAGLDAAIAQAGSSFQYDAVGRLIKSTDAFGKSSYAFYDAEGRQTLGIDQAGDLTESHYNSFGQLDRQSHDANSIDTTGLTAGSLDATLTGRITAARDAARDQVDTTAYDAYGRVQSVTDGEGYTSTYTYDAYNQIDSQTKTLGAGKSKTDKFKYDARGALISKLEDATGANLVTFVNYDAFGRVLKLTDALGQKTETIYRDNGRTVDVRDALQHVRTTQYDALSRVIVQTDANGQATRFAFDDVARTTTMTTPENVQVVTTRNRFQQTLAVTDARGTTSYTYNKNGQLLTVNDARLAVVTSNTYDRARLTDSQDARKTNTHYDYDSVGRVLARTVDPGGLALRTEYKFDGVGREIRITEAAGTPAAKVTVNTFDRRGMLTRTVQDPTGLRLTTNFDYDGNGQVVLMKRGALDALGVFTVRQATRYEYDGAGRRITETQAPSDVVAPQGTEQRDVVTRYRYDANGRLTRSIDAGGNSTWFVYNELNQVIQRINAEGDVSQTDYDANGRVWHTVAYATRLTSIAGFGDIVAKQTPTTSAQDAHQYSVYDKDGRQAFTVDALGGVVQRRFSAAGDVIEQVQFAKPYTGTVDLDSLTKFVATPANLDLTQDRHVRYAYDAAGRLTFMVDARGGIVQSRFNDAGDVIEQVQYANRYSGTFDYSSLSNYVSAATNQVASLDRHTRYVYDAAGRLRFSVDALGGVVERVYDAQGQVVRSIAYDTALQSGVDDTTTEVGMRTLLNTAKATQGNARETIYGYDALGRLALVASSLRLAGANKLFTLSSRQYDAVGNLSSSTAYATPVALQALALAPTLTDFQAKVVPSTLADRTDTYTYDALGHVLTHTDGELFVEKWGYDTRGNKTSFTNKNGAVFGYEYDVLGRLYTERSALVDVSRFTSALGDASSGLELLATTKGQRVQTDYRYDAFGNLLSRDEVDGAVSRKVSYGYDTLGHQTSVTTTSNSVYDAAQDSAANGSNKSQMKALVSSTSSWTTSTLYDVFGQAVINKDAAGIFSYKTYDQLGRVLSEVDGRKGATLHVYAPQQGGVDTSTRVSMPASLVDGLDVAAKTVNDAVQAAMAGDAANNRSLSVSYDKLGHQTSVATSTLFSYDSASNTTGTGQARTDYAYNVWGELIQQDVLLHTNGSKASSLKGYDLGGHLVRERDAAGYLKAYNVNAFGEIEATREYATQVSNLAADIWATPNPLDVIAGDPYIASGYDRCTQTIYDRRGLVLNQSQTGVLLDKTDANRNLTRVAGSIVNTNVYDGVGNVIETRSDTTGGLVSAGTRVNNAYDALGRLVATLSYTTADGDAVQQGRLTTFLRDRWGAALVTRQYGSLSTATGLSKSLVGGRTGLAWSASANDATDRVTLQQFDSLGHLSQSRLVNYNQDGQQQATLLQADHFYQYDAMGRLAKEWQPFVGRDSSELGAAQRYNNAKIYVYDGVGEITQTKTLIEGINQGSAAYSVQTTDYTSFGEVSTTSLDGQQTGKYEYDANGRMWRGTTGANGAQVVYQYDLAGRNTRVLTSQGDLDLATYASSGVVPTTSDVRVSINAYDARGKLTSQTNALNETVKQVLDAWGNVLVYTSALSHVTEYRYNTANQVVYEKKPQVSAYNQSLSGTDQDIGRSIVRSASPISINPTVTTYYDAWGHNVGGQDANGNKSAAIWSRTGELSKEYHSDGGLVTHGYSSFGQEVDRWDTNWNSNDATLHANARHYLYTYDKLGNKTLEQVDGRALMASTTTDLFNGATWAAGVRKLGIYTFDALGRRTSETTGEDDNYSGVTQAYWYDTLGRMQRSSRSIDIDVPSRRVGTYNKVDGVWNYDEIPGYTYTVTTGTNFAYDAVGHKTVETDAMNNTMRWSYDLSQGGRLDTHTDLSGAVTKYAYNKAGDLTTAVTAVRANQTLTYGYDALGRQAWIKDNWNGSQTTYAYDAEGNRTLDKFQRGTVVYRDSRIAYDALGRQIKAEDFFSGGSAADITINTELDANGNKLHVWGGYGGSGIERSYAYDAANRVIAKQDVDIQNDKGGTAVDVYTYDGEGMRTSMTRATGNAPGNAALLRRKLTLDYDFAGRVVSQRALLDFDNTTYTGVIGYDPNLNRPIMGPITRQDDAWVLKRSIFDATKGTATDYTASSSADSPDIFKLTSIGAGQSMLLGSTTTYDKFDRMVTLRRSQQTVGKTSSLNTLIQINSYDKAGNLAFSQSTTWAYTSSNTTADGSATRQYSYSYLMMDGYKQYQAKLDSGSQTSGTTKWTITPSTNTQQYDLNGNLLQYVDSAGGDNSAKYFVTDNAGQVVQSISAASTGNMVAAQLGMVYTPTRDGAASTPAPAAFSPTSGSIARPATPDVAPPDLPSGLTQSDQGTPKARSERTSVRNVMVLGDHIGALTTTSTKQMVTWAGDHGIFVNSSDTSFKAFDDLAGPAADASSNNGQTYVVKTGDTLRSLAQTFYGDANLWYVIAEANALGDDKSTTNALTSGLSLRIPDVSRATNTTGTYRVYQPSEIIGSTTPHGVDPGPPSPPGAGGCGVAQLIIVAVAVAVTIATQGATSSWLASTMPELFAANATAVAAGEAVAVANTAALVTSGAIAGAAGALASQSAGILLGVQNGYDWKAVGMAALGGAVTAGIGQAGALKGAEMATARALLSNVITQGIGVVTGLQKNFSWKSVAVSGLSAALNTGVADSIKGSDFADKILDGRTGVLTSAVANFVTGTTTQLVRMAVYGKGKLDYASLAADSFGNALGESVVEYVRPSYSAAEMESDRYREKSRFALMAAQNAALDGRDHTGDQGVGNGAVSSAASGESAEFDSHVSLPMGSPMPSAGSTSSLGADSAVAPTKQPAQADGTGGGAGHSVPPFGTFGYQTVVVHGTRHWYDPILHVVDQIGDFFAEDPQDLNVANAAAGDANPMAYTSSITRRDIAAAGRDIAGTLREIAENPFNSLSNAGHGVVGEIKGAINGVPEGAVTVIKGNLYVGAWIGDGLTSLVGRNSNYLGRAINATKDISGQILPYYNDSQRIGGWAGEFASPFVYGKLLTGARAAAALASSADIAVVEGVGNVGGDVEALRGLGGTNGHALAETVTPGGSGQAFAGHGVMNGTDTLFGQGQFVAPAGTTVVMPRPGITIRDSTGRLLENVSSVDELNQAIATGVGPNGQILTPRNLRDLQGYQVVQPGQTGPNLTLLDPGFQGKTLNIMQNSTTTLAPTRLSDLLEPNMGCVFWAACTQPVPYIPK